MAAALAYAQSGHLVLATLHANNSYQRAEPHHQLLPAREPPGAAAGPGLGRQGHRLAAAGAHRSTAAARPAVEVMLNTRYVADLIEKGEIGQIKEAMEKSLAPGSQTFEQALLQLIRDGLMTQEEALANADSPPTCTG